MRDYKKPQINRKETRRIVLAGHHWAMLMVVAVLVGSAIAGLPHKASATRAVVHEVISPQADRLVDSGTRAAVALSAPAAVPAPSEPTDAPAAIEPEPIAGPAAVRPAEQAPVTPAPGAPSADPQPTQPVPTADPLTQHSVTIKSGDSLARIFSRLRLSPRELHEIVNSGSETKALSRLSPGQVIRIGVDDDQRVQELVVELDWRRSLLVKREGDRFLLSRREREVETVAAHAQAVISSSLYEAAQAAGLPDNVIMELVGVFAWDIDFALDIRAGDSFTVLYEESFLDGERMRSGPILAAEFVNRGKSYRVVRYTDPKGKSDYYSPDGRSARKAFLRTPVSFARVSSRFGRRHHPVLNRMRMHKGVDYAAPRGTAVKASGDGKIVHRGRKGGYGKTVVVQHGGRYSTLYAHLASYRRGLRVGSRVRQGDVIGYVGSSGLATGPHLHYEFRVDGVHRNPLTVPLPDAKPVAAEWRDDFAIHSGDLIAQLEQVKATQVALNIPVADAE